MSEINREDAIANVALAIWHYPNELYTSLNCFENCQELAERALNCLPSAEPEKVLVAEVKLSKEDIQDAVDNAVEKIRAEMERKKGKWIDDGTELGCCCSECGVTLDDYFYGSLHEICLSKIPNFCPNCGADMRGEHDE